MQLKSLEKKFKKKFIIPYREQKFFKKMQKKHTETLQKVKGKNKVKVVFLAMNKSMWKVDTVFKKMLNDPFFELEILICPDTIYGEKQMLEDMEEAYDYFLEKKYPVKKSKRDDDSWIKLDEINPDIVFFTRPHNSTHEEYYENAYLNYLSCYVPYGHSVSKYDNYKAQYNQPFHNAMWMVFGPHQECLDIFKEYSATRGKNVVITGYPSCEAFFEDKKSNPWKSEDRLKVIWAPHHTISDPHIPYSNFLKMADDFLELTKRFSNDIQFAFKPHPILKSKLYLHPEWGERRTNAYYDYWAYSDNTQLELGEYIELFKYSDALIHDSGSFVAEYHYVKKPVFYIYNEYSKDHLNPFGIKAMESSYLGSDILDIEAFLNKLIIGSLEVDLEFYEKNIEVYFKPNMPSEKIINKIKSAFN